MPKPQKTKLSAGTKLDDWHLDKFIAAGGQGEVWQVQYVKGRRPKCALKVAFGNTGKERTRFANEIKTLSALRHRHVIPVFAEGIAQVHLAAGRAECPYYVMPQALGTLARPEILSRGLFQLMRWYRELLAGVAFLHQGGQLHRDLKPSNVLIVDEPGSGLYAAVSDFGLVREQVAQGDVTATHEVLGSHGYMAPELFRNEPASAQTEIFALGRVLDSLLNRRQPSSTPPGELSERARDALNAVVRRATAHDPQERFASVNALVEALPEFHLDVKPAARAARAPSAPQPPACPISPKSRIGHQTREGNGREVFWKGGSHVSLWVGPATSFDRTWDSLELSQLTTNMPVPNPDDRGSHRSSRNEYGFAIFPVPMAGDQRDGVDFVDSFSLVTKQGHVWCMDSYLCSLEIQQGDLLVRYLPAIAVERWFVQQLESGAHFLTDTLRIPGPCAWNAGMQWVNGFRLELGHDFSRPHSDVNYEEALTQSGVFDVATANAAVTLRPFFEHFWRAFGLVRPTR